jgi:phosphatidylglycerophosphate synthase
MLTVANLLTGLRLVPFALFVWAAHKSQVELTALCFALAWVPDAIDGWLARKLNQATSFGYVFDKAVDRLVLVGGMLVLLVTNLVPMYALLLATKDVVATPAAFRRRVRGGALRDFGRWGKAATLLQGTALLWLLLGFPYGLLVTLIVATFGVVAGAVYTRSLDQ